MNSLEQEKQIKKAKELVSDIINLFVFYYIFPENKDWIQFMDDYYNMKAMLEDNEITENDFNLWLQNFKETDLLELIILLSKSCKQFYYRDVWSITKQQEILNEAQDHNWLINLPEFEPIIKTLINKLKEVELKKIRFL